MFDVTKEQAMRKAEEVRRSLPGRNWEIRVWENLGWCWSVSTENLSVHGNVYNGIWSYSCLVGRDGGGEGLWHSTGATAPTPSAAVKASLGYARQIQAHYNQLLNAAYHQSGLFSKVKKPIAYEYL